MRFNAKSVVLCLFCGLAASLNAGCGGDRSVKVPTAAETAAGIDQQIKRVQSNPDMSDEMKASIIASLKSHPPPPPQPPQIAN
jgi:hypothetical protein